eukprot:2171673-Prymnesium_polylepis.1
MKLCSIDRSRRELSGDVIAATCTNIHPKPKSTPRPSCPCATPRRTPGNGLTRTLKYFCALCACHPTPVAPYNGGLWPTHKKKEKKARPDYQSPNRARMPGV